MDLVWTIYGLIMELCRRSTIPVILIDEVTYSDIIIIFKDYVKRWAFGIKSHRHHMIVS